MEKITDLVISWIKCSFDLYNKEYAKLDEGWHDFIPIEEKLFASYVSNKLPNGLRYSNMKEYFEHMVAEYKTDIDANRCYERIKNHTTIMHC